MAQGVHALSAHRHHHQRSEHSSISDFNADFRSFGGVKHTVGGLTNHYGADTDGRSHRDMPCTARLSSSSLITVGFASKCSVSRRPACVVLLCNICPEIRKAVSKETKIDILVTPCQIGVGIALSVWWAPALGTAAMWVGSIVMGHKSSAFPHGHLCLRRRRHRSYAADFLRSHLRRLRAHRSGRRPLCCCRLAARG